MEDGLSQLLQREQELQFAKFNEAVAWQIGSQLVGQRRREELPITIDITHGNHQRRPLSLAARGLL